MFDKLSAMAGKPIWQFDGAWDTTAGTESPKRTQKELEKLGDTSAKLTTIQTDHSGLSTQPFNVALMQWMKSKGGNGNASSSGSGSSSSSNDDVANIDQDDVKVVDNSGSGSSGSSSGSSGSSSSGSSTSGSSSRPKKCKASSSRKAKRSIGYAMAHAGPVRRGVYSAEAAGPAPAVQKKRSLSMAAILASREKGAAAAANKQAKRSPAAVAVGAVAVDNVLNARSLAPTEVETLPRRDPGLVAREQLKQSAAAARKLR